MAYPYSARLFALLVTAAILGGFAGAALMARAPVQAAPASQLPKALFLEGAKVRTGNAVYLIQRIEGDWIQAIPYRSLDEHDAPPGVSRWIYVPAVDAPWSAVSGA